jgi:hypothetical protein
MGPSTYTRIAEIMSGRANSQQGLVTTCKDPSHKGRPRRGEAVGLAHEPIGAKKEEQCLPRGLWKFSRSGRTPRPGKGALGTRWFQIGHVCPDTELGYRVWLPGTRIRVNQGFGVYVHQGLTLSPLGRPLSGKWRAEPRPEPDSGNPTVRDRREACGNVGYGDDYLGTYSGNAETDKSSPAATRATLLSRHPHVRFEERDVETEQGGAREAPADERAGKQIGST